MRNGTSTLFKFQAIEKVHWSNSFVGFHISLINPAWSDNDLLIDRRSSFGIRYPRLSSAVVALRVIFAAQLWKRYAILLRGCLSMNGLHGRLPIRKFYCHSQLSLLFGRQHAATEEDAWMVILIIGSCVYGRRIFYGGIEASTFQRQALW